MSFRDVNPGTTISAIYRELGRDNPYFAEVHTDPYQNHEWTCLGLLFSVPFRASIEERDECCTVHFIVAGWAVHVWSVVNPAWDAFTIPLNEWTNLSNHDSCWKYAIENKCTEVYFALCDKVQDARAPKDRVAPVKVNVTASLQFLHCFHWVRVHYGPDESDKHGYRVSLTRLERTSVIIKEAGQPENE